MAAISHTSTEQIRAAFGATAAELPDNLMVDLDLGTLILIELNEVYPDHQTAIDASVAASPSTAEVALGGLIRLYCAYQGAVTLLTSIQVSLPQKVVYGDTEVQRFSKDNLERTEEKITGMRDYLRSKLNPTDYPEVTDVFIPLTTSTPSYDPVTNEGA